MQLGWLQVLIFSCLIPPSTANIVEHLYDKVGFKTHLAMDINYDDGYRLKGSSPWWAAKSTVGVITAVRASDQVRQHMAWALAQIVVVGAGLELRAPELWLNYYDIMVRNALGNFRDILQEVTYSPVMGKYLTHTGSSSSDFDGNFPNENYAREVMQLFSVGVLRLHDDGSAQRDAAGEVLLSYTTTNILAHSRDLTSLTNQPMHHSTEGSEAPHEI